MPAPLQLGLRSRLQGHADGHPEQPLLLEQHPLLQLQRVPEGGRRAPVRALPAQVVDLEAGFEAPDPAAEVGEAGQLRDRVDVLGQAQVAGRRQQQRRQPPQGDPSRVAAKDQGPNKAAVHPEQVGLDLHPLWSQPAGEAGRPALAAAAGAALHQLDPLPVLEPVGAQSRPPEAGRNCRAALVQVHLGPLPHLGIAATQPAEGSERCKRRVGPDDHEVALVLDQPVAYELALELKVGPGQLPAVGSCRGDGGPWVPPSGG